MEGGYTPEQLVELDVIRAEYAWMNPNAIEDVREQQRQGRIEAGTKALTGVNLLESDDFAADYQKIKDARNHFDNSSREMAELYVANHLNRDENEELFDRAVAIIERYSHSNVDTKSWRSGTAAGGYTDTENSGRNRAEVDFEEFCQGILSEGLTEGAELLAAEDTLETARNRYAHLLAERSKRSVNIKYRQSDLEEAKAAYHEAYSVLADLIMETDEIEALTDDEREQAIRYGSAVETLALINAEIREKLNSGSEKTRKFLDFWARQGGNDGGLLRKLKGMTVKGGILGSTGAVAGAAVSVALAPIAGTVAGGAAGLGAAVYVGRKLFASRINRSADALTVAEMQGQYKLSELNRLADEADSPVGIEDVTNYMDNKMRESIARNRTRDAVGLMLGAAVGHVVGELVDGRVSGSDKVAEVRESQQPSTPAPTDSGSSDVVGAPVPAPEEIASNREFEYTPHTVQSGEGITHVIQDLARDNGVELTPQELFDIYNDNKSGFAQLENVIPMNVQGDYGIASPGVQLDIPPDLLEELYEDIQAKSAA